MTALATELVQGRTVVPHNLFFRLVTFLMQEEGMDRDRAERVMDQGLAFVETLGRTGACLSPSKDVDPAWHAFLLHSKQYAEWCTERFGRVIHHDPASRKVNKGMMVDVTARIEAQGFIVDQSLWSTPHECNPPACCGDGDGC